MAHKRIIREGHKVPDRSKLYAVVEKPTAGKDKGQITKTFAIDLSWDDAQKKKHWLAANRKTKFATVIPMPSEEEIERVLGSAIDAIAQNAVNTVADVDEDLEELECQTTASSLAAKWPTAPVSQEAEAHHALASGTIALPTPATSGTTALPTPASSFSIDDGKVTPIGPPSIEKP